MTRRAGKVTMAVRAGGGAPEILEVLAKTIEDPDTSASGRAACVTAWLKVRSAQKAAGESVEEKDIIDELAVARTRRRRSS